VLLLDYRSHDQFGARHGLRQRAVTRRLLAWHLSARGCGRLDVAVEQQHSRPKLGRRQPSMPQARTHLARSQDGLGNRAHRSIHSVPRQSGLIIATRFRKESRRWLILRLRVTFDLAIYDERILTIRALARSVYLLPPNASCRSGDRLFRGARRLNGAISQHYRGVLRPLRVPVLP
jgi:hypothetical protein